MNHIILTILFFFSNLKLTVTSSKHRLTVTSSKHKLTVTSSKHKLTVTSSKHKLTTRRKRKEKYFKGYSKVGEDVLLPCQICTALMHEYITECIDQEINN